MNLLKLKNRVVTVLLALAMVAGMAACNSSEPPAVTDGETTVQSTVTDGGETDPATESNTETDTEGDTEAVTDGAPEAPEADPEEGHPQITPEEERIDELLECKTTLRFDENGQFRILVLSDLHIPSGGIPTQGMAYIRQVVEKEQPDLIILDGDNVVASLATDKIFMRVLKPLATYFESQGIYWMHVFGNHDCESDVTLEEQQAVYESFDYCLSKDPDPEISGVGNYVLPIYGSDTDEVKFAVWGIDSNNYLSEEDQAAMFPSGASSFEGYSGTNYDYIHYDQIEWYREASMLMESQLGRKIPGLMAFHIPLQESYTAWENRESLEWTGNKQESVCASAYNSGLFEVLRQRGDIKAVVNGHDHVNDYMVDYAGIKLCYASTVTTTTYGGPIGARVFVLNEENPADMDTYVSYLFEEEESPDLPALSGVVADFEGDAPDFTVQGWNGESNNGGMAEVAAGKGKDGSNALAAYRSAWAGSNNTEIIWDIPQPGRVGENKYLVVWMDLSANDVDFRKASFGVLANNVNANPYRTDNYDEPSPFYYKAEGSDEWVTMSMGDDGCFGAEQDSSVLGYKGWFAFPLEYMTRSGGVTVTANTAITGLYFYFSPKESSYMNKPVYIDNIQLAEDYTAVN